ncbi:hypothetical protein QAD02_001980 [Eretmocerus hayati]|uniref:Uncharacterized protein n=1 Tax=Eretmocerus hayati TaxID=131215 RepID=A0ACC2NJB6_9HYME|nr:hypothetical protein QAD02_001980 [Eretmocerus hayati]
MDNSDDGEDEIGGNETIDVDVMDSVLEQARRIRLESLPIRSKKHYTQHYNKYKKWCSDNKIPNFINEDVMLLYRDHLHKDEKSTSSPLWAVYSMLQSCTNAYDNVDITNYAAIRKYIKQKHRGHKPKKAAAFTVEQVHTFAIFVVSLSGCLRRVESTYLLLENVTKLDNGTFLITIPLENTKTYVERSFTVVGDFAEILQRYLDARMGLVCPRLFLIYRSNTFINSPTGINTVGRVPKVIATFLKIPDIKTYTSHCIRRTAATILADSGASIDELMRFEVWKSPGCARGYVVDSRFVKDKMAHQFTDAIIPVTKSNVPTVSHHDQNNVDNFVTAAQVIQEDSHSHSLMSSVIGARQQVPVIATVVNAKPSTSSHVSSSCFSTTDCAVPSTSGVQFTFRRPTTPIIKAVATLSPQSQYIRKPLFTSARKQLTIPEAIEPDDSGISLDGQEFEESSLWGYDEFKPTPERTEALQSEDSDVEIIGVTTSLRDVFAGYHVDFGEPTGSPADGQSSSSLDVEVTSTLKDEVNSQLQEAVFDAMLEEDSSDESDSGVEKVSFSSLPNKPTYYKTYKNTSKNTTHIPHSDHPPANKLLPSSQPRQRLSPPQQHSQRNSSGRQRTHPSPVPKSDVSISRHSLSHSHHPDKKARKSLASQREPLDGQGAHPSSSEEHNANIQEIQVSNPVQNQRELSHTEVLFNSQSCDVDAVSQTENPPSCRPEGYDTPLKVMSNMAGSEFPVEPESKSCIESTSFACDQIQLRHDDSLLSSLRMDSVSVENDSSRSFLDVDDSAMSFDTSNPQDVFEPTEAISFIETMQITEGQLSAEGYLPVGIPENKDDSGISIELHEAGAQQILQPTASQENIEMNLLPRVIFPVENPTKFDAASESVRSANQSSVNDENFERSNQAKTAKRGGV